MTRRQGTVFFFVSHSSVNHHLHYENNAYQYGAYSALIVYYLNGMDSDATIRIITAEYKHYSCTQQLQFTDLKILLQLQLNLVNHTLQRFSFAASLSACTSKTSAAFPHYHIISDPERQLLVSATFLTACVCVCVCVCVLL